MKRSDVLSRAADRALGSVLCYQCQGGGACYITTCPDACHVRILEAECIRLEAALRDRAENEKEPTP